VKSSTKKVENWDARYKEGRGYRKDKGGISATDLPAYLFIFTSWRECRPGELHSAQGSFLM
jgi:hypothetical protein